MARHLLHQPVVIFRGEAHPCQRFGPANRHFRFFREPDGAATVNPAWPDERASRDGRRDDSGLILLRRWVFNNQLVMSLVVAASLIRAGLWTSGHSHATAP